MIRGTQLAAGVLLCCLCACAGGSGAGTVTAATAGTTGQMSFAGGFFALSVADADASARWYSEKLDLQVARRPPKSNDTTVIVMEGHGLTVELLQSDQGVPLSKVAPSVHDRLLVHGIVKAGAIVDDFDAAVATLKQRGVPIFLGPFEATAGQPANLVVRDAEGNLIQLLGK